MDQGTRPTRATIQAPSGERHQTTSAPPSQEDPRWTVLPAPLGVRRDGHLPEEVRLIRHGRLLVVFAWSTTAQAPSLHTVQGLEGAEAAALEGCRRDVRAAEPAHTFGETL